MSGEHIPEFKYPAGYPETIAHVANTSAHIEYYVSSSIWLAANMPMGIGACITTQIYTLQGKLSALLALLKLRSASAGLISRVNKFSESVRGATEDRNRIIHDIWLVDSRDPNIMARLEVTAAKKLKFETSAHGRNRTEGSSQTYGIRPGRDVSNKRGNYR